MILGTQWNDIKLICGNHGDDISNEMVLHQGREGMSVFYSCPCYQSILKEESTGKSCNNRLNIVDYEKALEALVDEKIDEDGNVVPLKGLTLKRKGVNFKVLEEKDNQLVVKMLNVKAINS